MLWYIFRSFKWLFQYLGAEPKKKKNLKPRKELVRFAAAVPAYNEGVGIARTVRSLLKANIRPEDIYILCNGCTDDTAEQVRLCGVEPIISPVRGKEETLAWACDDAKLFSRYTHVGFFDADTEVDSKFFKFIRERLRADEAIDIICGKPKSMPFNRYTAHRAVRYWSFHKIHKEYQADIGAILVVPGCAGVYSTESLKKIVWSPDTRIGDMDATIQAALQGMKIAFEPRAFVLTQDPATFSAYTNQLYRRWNRGLWMNMRKHGILWKGPFSPLHWNCRGMFFDQFLPFLFLGVAWYFELPIPIFGSIGIFVLWVLFETIMCAWQEDRWDIVKYFPLFPLLSMYDMILFILSSWTILLRREKNGVWNSPPRYSLPSKN